MGFVVYTETMIWSWNPGTRKGREACNRALTIPWPFPVYGGVRNGTEKSSDIGRSHEGADYLL